MNRQSGDGPPVRHITLALLASAFLAEIHRLLCRCALTVAHSLEHILHWFYWRRRLSPRV